MCSSKAKSAPVHRCYHYCIREKASRAFRGNLLREKQFVSISITFKNTAKQYEESILTQVYAIRCSGTLNNDITKGLWDKDQ